MSAKVIDLSKYRNKKHRSWFVENEARLSDIVRSHLFKRFAFDFELFAEAYKNQKRINFDESWDYLDLRDLIAEVIEESRLLEYVIEDLRKKKWFDESQISRQKLLEICLSIFVLETGQTG